MMVIWGADGPVTSAYVSEKLKDKKDWKITSVLTFLARLVEKGFLESRREGKINIYSPLVKEQDYLGNESRTILEKLYGNSLTTFVASLYRSNTISGDDLEELRRFIDQAAKED